MKNTKTIRFATIVLSAVLLVSGCSTTELPRADRLLKDGAHREARAIYSRQAAQHPRSFRAHYGLAMSWCAEALQKSELGCGTPQDWLTPIYHMNLAYTIGAGEKAQRNLAIFHYNLGAAFHREEKIQDAIKRLEQSVSLDTMLVKAHNLLGTIYHQRGNLSQAQRCYRKVIQIQPDYAMAHFNLGALSWARGDYETAAGCFEDAVSLAPHNGHFLLWLEKAQQILSLDDQTNNSEAADR
ncbi:MAG: tetratricopeptide repeat protein [Chitinivibrionales bacterium]